MGAGQPLFVTIDQDREGYRAPCRAPRLHATFRARRSLVALESRPGDVARLSRVRARPRPCSHSRHPCASTLHPSQPCIPTTRAPRGDNLTLPPLPKPRGDAAPKLPAPYQLPGGRRPVPLIMSSSATLRVAVPAAPSVPRVRTQHSSHPAVGCSLGEVLDHLRQVGQVVIRGDAREHGEALQVGGGNVRL